MAPNWSSLPSDLIVQISNRLSTVEDFSSFTAVCRSFQSAASKQPRTAAYQPPWLLLSCNEEDKDKEGKKDNFPIATDRGLVSMYRNNKKFHMKLPELHGRHCWGTCHGWIITLGLDLQLHLFNPLNRRRITLPKIAVSRNAVFANETEKAQWMRYTFIRKALLLKKPDQNLASPAERMIAQVVDPLKPLHEISGSNTVDDKNSQKNRKNPPSPNSKALFDEFFVGVATAEEGRLRIMSPETDTWEYMNEIHLGSEVSTGPICDVVNYNDRIYALCGRGRMLICSNLDGPAVEILPNDERLIGDEKLYLVESNGDLLMVVRYINYDILNVFRYLSCESLGVEKWYDTSGFGVFKLNEDVKEWVGIEDLGDRALFVGDCQSISLSSPEKFNCQSNCIYFTDDNYEHFKFTKGHDIGVFCLKYKSIWRFYEGADTLSSYSAPNWFIPTFV